LRRYNKGVTLPEDFKATDKMLGRDITSQVSRVPQMAVNALRIRRLE
jgi:hypothetical protein